METWGYVVIALIVALLICFALVLSFLRRGAKAAGSAVKSVAKAGTELIRQWRKAGELEVDFVSRIVTHDPRLEVMRTDVIVQGEFRGRLPFLKFLKKEVHAYLVYPVEVRYYIPFSRETHFRALDEDIYGGLENVALRVADVEAEISGPSLTRSKLFIDIESGKIGRDEKNEILKKCWEAVELNIRKNGMPPSVEQNKAIARGFAVNAVNTMLRTLGIVQPVTLQFVAPDTGKILEASGPLKLESPQEETYLIGENDINVKTQNGDDEK